MRRLSLSWRIYWLLVAMLAAGFALNAWLPQGSMIDAAVQAQAVQQAMPPRWQMALAYAGVALVLYGGLGAIGMVLAQRMGFADLWDPAVTNWQRFVIPALWGAALGLFFIVADSLFSRVNPLGGFPHPPFPTSLVASLNAGIGEEILFRLFFIPFWMWLISGLILGGRGREPIFWIVTTFSAIAFAAGHLPTALVLTQTAGVGDLPASVLAEMLLLNGALSFVAAWLFRRFGILAAMGVHFWTDIVWHVIWGLI